MRPKNCFFDIYVLSIALVPETSSVNFFSLCDKSFVTYLNYRLHNPFCKRADLSEIFIVVNLRLVIMITVEI